jgi:MazG family protein
MSTEIFSQLKATIAKLRDPKDGCPWDLEQTHETLIPYLIEESFEFLDAVERKSFDDMKDELGDVLLQVFLHSQLASEKQLFTIEDVAQTINQKMIRRHPHVFETPEKKITKEKIKENWKSIKEQEKGKQESIIPRKYLHNPSLLSSYKIGKETEKIQFDWGSPKDTLEKVHEELEELKQEVIERPQKDPAAIEEEMGDLLFTVAQLARHLQLNPEDCLRKANKKFLKRFHMMEELSDKKGIPFEELSLQEKEQLWIEVKQCLKSTGN